MRIGTKLVVSYTILAIITFLVTGIILRASIAYFYAENLSQHLIAQANAFEVAINELGDGSLSGARTRPLIKKLAQSTDTRITLIDADGVVIADTQAINPGMMPNHAEIAEVQQALAGKTGTGKRFSNVIKQDVLYIAVPYEKGGEVQGAIRIALPMSEVDKALDKFGIIILAIAIAASMLVVITSYILSNSFTTPLKHMMIMAHRIARDDLDHRLPENRSDEIGELSKSLNYLAEKVTARIDELRTEKAKAVLILDNMAEGILLLNNNGEVILTNPSAERIFNIRASKILGSSGLSTTGNPELEKAFRESITSRKEVDEEVELQDPFKQLRIRVLPIKNSLGEDQALAVIKDITREKLIERLRKDFVANVSHELKTPLTGMKLLSETLLRSIDTDPESSKRFVKRLDKEISTIIHMVRELIDLSRIETTQSAIEKEPTDLGEIVREVGSSFSERAENKGLTLTLNMPENIALVLADKDQILTMVRNLVDNAIRYTPSGGHIKVGLKETEGRVGLVVADDGIGLAKREISRIFERFYRVDKARSRETGGTGLGLSIVKHIAENHNATITVDSQLGIGSTFKVSFPIGTPASPGDAPLFPDETSPLSGPSKLPS